MNYVEMPQTDGGADFSLVELDTNKKPSCKVHGAMNKVTPSPPGFWRCLQGKCRAGCQDDPSFTVDWFVDGLLRSCRHDEHEACLRRVGPCVCKCSCHSLTT